MNLERSFITDILLKPLASILLLVFFRLSVKGARKLPRKGGFIVAGNHISDMDPPVAGVAVPRASFFMAKSELFRNPISGSFLRLMGAFPVYRRASVNSDALKTAEKVVKSGKVLIIFPEGTRTKDGKMLPAKAGVGYIAINTGAPVCPFWISGTDNPVGALLFKHRFRVVFGDPITPETVSALNEQGGPKKIAEYIMDKVKEIKETNTKGAL